MYRFLVVFEGRVELEGSRAVLRRQVNWVTAQQDNICALCISTSVGGFDLRRSSGTYVPKR